MIYVIIIIALCGADLFIKHNIEKNGDLLDDKPIFKGFLRQRKYHNEGAMLNLLQTKKKLVAAISTTFTVLMTIVFIITLSTSGKKMLKTGLALLLGGAYSNNYDRLKRHYVVDYVSFPVKWQKLRNVVFNIGDFGIIIGALLLVLSEGRE